MIAAGGTTSDSIGNVTTAETATEELLTTTDLTKNGLVTLILIIIFISTLIFNVILLIVCASTKELRTAVNTLLISVAVADLLSAFFWILPAMVTSATWNWIMGVSACQVVGFAGTLCYGVNVFTLLAVSLERMFRFWSPSRHKLAFTRMITLILIVTLWIFSAMFAIIPLAGWTNYSYVEPRFTCLVNFGLSYSMLHFYTVAGYGLPLFFGLVFFLAVLVKLILLKRNGRDTAGVSPLLEERTDRIGESYGQKFKRQEDKYRDVANKSYKPNPPRSSIKTPKSDVNQMTPTTDGDSDYDVSDNDLLIDGDDEECFTDYSDAIRRRRQREILLRQRRKYRLHRRDVSTTLTVFIIWLVYMVLWLPYIILNYVWIYGYFPDYSNRATHTVVMLVAMTSMVYKPLIYLTNRRNRTLVKTRIKKG